MSAPCEAKPSKDRSRLRERREAQDRRSRPRALTAADAQALLFKAMVREAARRRAIEARPTLMRNIPLLSLNEAEE